MVSNGGKQNKEYFGKRKRNEIIPFCVVYVMIYLRFKRYSKCKQIWLKKRLQPPPVGGTRKTAENEKSKISVRLAIKK